MNNDWTKMRADVETELQRRFSESGTGSAPGPMRSRKASVLGHIIFWAVIISGSITLFEILR